MNQGNLARVLRGLSLISFLILFLAFACSLFAKEEGILSGGNQTPTQTGERTVGPFSGTVVDAAGKPVPGAKVWLLGGVYPADPQVVAETTTDEQGKFKIEAMKWNREEKNVRPPRLTARDAQGRMGGDRHFFHAAKNPSGSNENGPNEYGIRLVEVKEYQGRLVDLEGQPIAHATVTPRGYMDNPVTEKSNDPFELPAAIRSELATETAADGSFTIKNLPSRGQMDLLISAAGYGKLWARVSLDKTSTIPLGRAGNVQGMVHCEKNPAAAAGIKMEFYTSKSSEQKNDRRERKRELLDWDIFYSNRALTEKDGAFRWENVPPGLCSIQPELPEDFPYYVERFKPIEVKSGETAKLALTLKPAVKLQGKMIDRQSGEGVPGVMLQLISEDGAGRSSQLTTDSKGEFTRFVPPGKASFRIIHAPDPYLNPSSQQLQNLDIQGDTILDPIRLERVNVLEGIVVDTSGNPVPDAEIFYRSVDMQSSVFPERDLRSDLNGKFILKRIPAKETVSIRARTSTACSEPVKFTPGELKAPLRLVVNEKTSFTIRGTIVDDAGRPIPHAEVVPTVSVSFGNWSTYCSGRSSATNAEGVFEIGGLWPGEGTQVHISATHFTKYGSGEIKGVPGAKHDFGKIMLQRSDGVVAGKIVDTAGKPLADVRVFNSGDAEEPIETLSDHDGKFSLSGFRVGPVYVFAEKDGYRFVGMPANTGITDLTLQMPRNDEPAVQRPRQTPSVSYEEQKVLARKLLEKLWNSGDQQQKWAALSVMAKCDWEQAQRWSAESGGKLDAALQGKLTKKIAETDLDEALSLIEKEGDRGYYTLKELANYFAATDQEKSMRCATEALLKARNLNQPQRAVGIAEMGALRVRLGKPEAGRKLVEEALETAEKWKSSGQNHDALGTLAVAVGTYDMPHAESLLKSISDKGERDRFQMKLAAMLDDPEKVEAMLKGVSPWYAQRVKVRLACRLVSRKPKEAIQLLEGEKESYGDDARALTFGCMAVTVSPQDKPLAYSLIDRAYDIYVKPSDRSSGPYGGRAIEAAILAVQGQTIGYPDMDKLVNRALLLRPTMKNQWSPVSLQESNVVTAMYLALIEPETAKKLLQPLEADSEAIGAGTSGSGMGREDWFKAWALADPQHALEMVERELASAKDSNSKSRALHAVREVAELWLTEPEKRLELFTQRFGGMFTFTSVFLPEEEN